MKAAPFDYVSPTSVEQVTRFLSKGGGDAIVLAGGQSLMPMLAMRMARPEMVIDINNVSELAGIEETNGEIVIKTCTRQADALASPVIQQHLPLLASALAFVGHTQTRNRGTIGGSLAHADPASEIPLVALTMDAEVTLQSTSASRRVAISKFFTGPMMTIREPEELLVSLHFTLPQLGAQVGTGCPEMSEGHGDSAMVAVAARIELGAHGACKAAALSFGGVDALPVRIAALEDILLSNVIDDAVVEAALAEIPSGIDPATDQHATADYRHRVAMTLAKRAIADAMLAAKRGAA